MAKALIAAGSNLGDRRLTIDRAFAKLDEHAQVKVIKKSQLYRSQPSGGPAGQDEFLNGAVLVETTSSPEQLLELLKEIEESLGRKRHRRWDARTIDLDLLLFDDTVIATISLVVPHPRMSFRTFVLEPSAEIAPDMRHPVIGWTVEELRAHIDSADRYLALVGSDNAVAEQLAASLCKLRGFSLASEAPCGSQRPTLVTFEDITGRAEAATIEFDRVRPALSIVLDQQSERQSPGGPLLRLFDMDCDAMVDEVSAAVAAMEPVHVA